MNGPIEPVAARALLPGPHQYTRPGRPARAPLLPHYPIEPWRVREQGFNPATAGQSETVFALANGRLGLRGNLEEEAGNAVHGTYLNGFHEEAPIIYGEDAHGFARNHQVILNLADGKRIQLFLDGEPLDLATGEVEYHERALDLRTGILSRRLRWRSPGGRRVEVSTRRLVSFSRPAVAMLDYRVTLLEAPRGDAEVRLVSTLVEGPGNLAASDDPRVGSHVPAGALVLERREAEADAAGGVLVQRAKSTAMAVGVAVRHSAWWVRGQVLDHDAPRIVSDDDDGRGFAHAPQEAYRELAAEARLIPGGVASTFAARMAVGDGMHLVKALAYEGNQHLPDDAEVAVPEPLPTAPVPAPEFLAGSRPERHATGTAEAVAADSGVAPPASTRPSPDAADPPEDPRLLEALPPAAASSGQPPSAVQPPTAAGPAPAASGGPHLPAPAEPQAPAEPVAAPPATPATPEHTAVRALVVPPDSAATASVGGRDAGSSQNATGPSTPDAEPATEPPSDVDVLAAAARAEASRALADGFDRLAAEQVAVLDAFWRDSDVELDGDDALQQGVRFNLFTVFGSAGRDGRTSLPAKGLTGEGYEGHVFWDTEVFALPFFAYTQPAIARSLLQFRIGTLPQARRRATEMSEPGALFPWRTINGDEASAYFPAGTAQYHINADVALAFVRYVHATGDRALLHEGGAELLFETARLWIGLGAYIPAHNGEFCINEVTGPDEYTALVNNNAYTNLMAREHLRSAIQAADELAREEPAIWARISGEIGLTLTEVDGWREAVRRMRIPRDRELGIHLQDDAFLDREPWDFAATPPDHYPLLLHYHPLVIYRHRVLKQPDVVLAQVLLAKDFTRAEKRRNFNFYDPLTTGDSSLAPCIQSVAAAELGNAEAAYLYFASTARMDLDDVNGNTRDGVHVAAMAGTWTSLVAGFGGLRDDDGLVSFSPRLPAAWRRLAFRIRIGASRLRVEITPAEATYTLESGPPVALRHFNDAVAVQESQPATFDLRPRLRAVVFDLDGVLTDTAEFHYRAWARMAADEGIPFSRELNERLKGIGRMESLGIILDAAGQGGLDQQTRDVLAERKNRYFGELIAQITPRDLLPGIGALLSELRGAGIRIAIASASHNASVVVGRLGIEGAVDAIVDPATLVKGKPDPEIFLAAAELLGVRPEDCVGVEDARAGIEAINAAGMLSVGVGTDLPGAVWTVDDTRRLTLESLRALFRPPEDQAAEGEAGPGVEAATPSEPGPAGA